jgi:hypothetical protein
MTKLIKFIACLALWCTSAHADLWDFTHFPDKFHIKQDRSQRKFHFQTATEYLGAAVNCSEGSFDIYNEDGVKECTNYADELLDVDGALLGTLYFEMYDFSLMERFYLESNCMSLYSPTNELLLVLDSKAEISNDVMPFFFRDPETSKIVAIGRFSRNRRSETRDNDRNYWLNDWSVKILDPARLQERQITPVQLIWMLLKHSQRHMPSPLRCPYYAREEQFSAFSKAELTQSLPTAFSVIQDPDLRLFKVEVENQCIAQIANTGFRSFVCVDSNNALKWMHDATTLYSSRNRPVAHFSSLDTFSMVENDNDAPLLDVNIVDTEETTLAFRDAETLEPVAVATWNYKPSFKYYLPWIYHNSQEWNVIILDPDLCAKNQITLDHFLWILMTYSEKELPYPCVFPYIKDPSWKL